MKRLSLGVWKHIFTNMKEDDFEIEIVWLDGSNEWVLCSEYMLFEDGFKTESEAEERLRYIERTLL